MKQLALIVAGAALFGLALRSGQPVGQNVGDLPTVRKIQDDRNSPATVNPRADVSLIVFTDYQCPACRASEGAMQEAVARDGKVRIVYKEWPIFGPRSERAARVALASAYQTIYPAVHHALMTGKRPDEAMLRETIERAGGDWRQLERDLVTHRADIDAELARNRMHAFSLGLEGTPAYLIGPILVRGGLSKAQFLRTITAAREAKRPGQ
ncbi:thioredoxin domain-containing protein [Sphingomonas sp. ID1715]|uniref:DsbA family protein n=1 Tax=Sphingomonas sp. ID1715 TaxID=1656898 RepID=UPI0014886111|nr:DsbA family protein [Sphingomonas sp. ID1715]NNM77791.1 thioredoxin domain-containing protein [Sphingomonas sp. ID1715]